jgi:hypothetical protein
LGGIASNAWRRTEFAHVAAISSLLLTTRFFLTGPFEPRIGLMVKAIALYSVALATQMEIVH